MKNYGIRTLGALLAGLMITPATAQDFDWGAFARDVAGSAIRQATQDDRDQRWRDRRDRRYEEYRNRARDYQGDYRNIYSGGNDGGRYVVNFPFGNVAVRTSPEQPPARVSGAAYGRWLAVHIDDALGNMHGVLQGTGTAGIPREIRMAQEDIDRVARAFSNGNRGAAQDHFRDFNQNWNRVRNGLSNTRDLPQPERLYQLNRELAQYARELNAMFQRGGDRGFGYDRVRVAALVDRLERQTERLENRFDDEFGRRRGRGRLDRLVSRVDSRARDLYQAVHNDDPYEYVAEEYRSFDRSWHNLRDVTRSRARVDRMFGEIDRNVAQIDRRLHRELNIDTPAIGGGQAALGLAESVARASRRLSRELSYTNALRGSLRDSMDALVASTDQLTYVMDRNPARSSRVGDQLRRVEDHIEEVVDLIDDRDLDGRFEDLAENIESDVDELEDRIG